MISQDLKKRLQVQEQMIYGKTYSEFDLELDAYRKYVSECLPGFINFMELLNSAITTLEDDLVMSNIKFKARLKDGISSLKNTENKALDDIFGFELITPNERDKEILMLLMHKIFDEKLCYKAKNHDKSNGYKAHHCIGILKHEFTGDEFSDIEAYILNAKGKAIKKKYRDLTKQEQADIGKEELYEQIDLYPTLKKQILEEGGLDDGLSEELKDIMLSIGQHYENNKQIKKIVPPIEVQFKTAAVAEEAIYGTARHAIYKPMDTQTVIDKYNGRRLMRGMDFPFKFHREDGKMRLQSTNLTLVEMWPFLKDAIRNFRRRHPTQLASYDMYIATVFPELKPYVKELAKKEPCITVKNQDKDAIWRLLKLKVINQNFIIPDYKSKNQNRGEPK